MLNPTVPDAMAEAFEKTEGDLSARMMAALEAAQGEGGDIRGMQSAAMVVVTGEPTGQSWRDRLIDLRVDDSPQPLKELARLINISNAYDHMNKGDDFIVEGKLDEAGREYATAAELAPGRGRFPPEDHHEIDPQHLPRGCRRVWARGKLCRRGQYCGIHQGGKCDARSGTSLISV